MTMTETAPEFSPETETIPAKRLRFKNVVAGILVGGTALALCGFTYAGVSNDKADEQMKKDVSSIAVQLDAWASNHASPDATVTMSTASLTGNPEFDAIKSNPSLQGVVWSVQGTADAYCIKAYSKAGGTYTPFNVLTYDSKNGGLGAKAGACVTKVSASHDDTESPKDNTDINS